MSATTIWEGYFEHFGLEPHTVRTGCEPRLIMKNERADNAIVLVHGLTDSPFFMQAIGEYFADELGFNVFMPLLAGHGLRDPRGMKGVSREAWIENVDYAVARAGRTAGKVSIGGLSTGGTLSVHRALYDPIHISGAVYLFSAAIDLTGQYGDIQGEIREILLRMGTITAIAGKGEDKKPLIGANPYRYSRMDIDGAKQLAHLIAEVDKATMRASVRQPLFAAHSECDQAASIKGIQELVSASPVSELFCIESRHNVVHASVVLKENVTDSSGEVLEKANPKFADMMDAIYRFTSQHLG